MLYIFYELWASVKSTINLVGSWFSNGEIGGEHQTQNKDGGQQFLELGT